MYVGVLKRLAGPGHLRACGRTQRADEEPCASARCVPAAPAAHWNNRGKERKGGGNGGTLRPVTGIKRPGRLSETPWKPASGHFLVTPPPGSRDPASIGGAAGAPPAGQSRWPRASRRLAARHAPAGCPASGRAGRPSRRRVLLAAPNPIRTRPVRHSFSGPDPIRARGRAISAYWPADSVTRPEFSPDGLAAMRIDIRPATRLRGPGTGDRAGRPEPHPGASWPGHNGVQVTLWHVP
jgi:hypothetical protein